MAPTLHESHASKPLLIYTRRRPFISHHNTLLKIFLFRLDLNQKRLQHKKEFLEQKRSQTRKLFAPPNSSVQQAPSSAPTTTGPPQPLQVPPGYPGFGYNNLFGMPSFESLGTQSSFNMTSVSQQAPYFPPPLNVRLLLFDFCPIKGYKFQMDLVTKVQELTAQNTQLMGANLTSLESLSQLVEAFRQISNSLKVWTENFTQNVPPPPRPLPPMNHVFREPPIARIPVKPAASFSSGNSGGGGGCSSSSNGIHQNGVNGTSKPKLLRTRKSPKVKVEHVIPVGRAVTAQMLEGPRVETVTRAPDDISEDDEAPLIANENWHIPNAPREVCEQWHMLRQQYNPNDQEPFFMSDKEIRENLLYRAIAHCGDFLPPWIYPNFRDAVAELFDELYTENESRSEILSALQLYPDTEPMEAAVEQKLYDFLWPMICKAIRKTSDGMYLNTEIFSSEKTEWIFIEQEFDRFRAEMSADDLSLSSEDSFDDYLSTGANRPPPDLQALAQERIDEVSEEDDVVMA